MISRRWATRRRPTTDGDHGRERRSVVDAASAAAPGVDPIMVKSLALAFRENLSPLADAVLEMRDAQNETRRAIEASTAAASRRVDVPPLAGKVSPPKRVTYATTSAAPAGGSGGTGTMDPVVTNPPEAPVGASSGSGKSPEKPSTEGDVSTPRNLFAERSAPPSRAPSRRADGRWELLTS